MIDSSTLKYRKFRDPRRYIVEGFTDGESGSKYIGTDSDGNKYIVKEI